MPTIDGARLHRRLAALARFGALEGGGVTRPCWSPAHEEARRWLLAEMRGAGLQTWVDPAGNTFGALGARAIATADPVVLTGSHIDTVPEGGPLDGALGVMAGLECLDTIHRAGVTTRRPLAVAAWSDEEGRYGSLFGSRAFCGALEPAAVPAMAAADGERLVDAMARAGFDPARAVEARAASGAVAAYLELHIEQGARLEEAGVPIGVVQAIVGVRRARLVWRGQADHAGTTPMARRRDAFVAAADYALQARELIVSRGGQLVGNIGVVHVHPGVSNIVPGRVTLTQEMRDAGPDTLERAWRDAMALAARIGQARGVPVDIQPLSATAPALCAPRVQRAVEHAADALGLAWQRLTSAAGHDAQNLASITEAGMLFVPSHGGRSHRIDESSDPRALERGAQVLLDALIALAT